MRHGFLDTKCPRTGQPCPAATPLSRDTWIQLICVSVYVLVSAAFFLAKFAESGTPPIDAHRISAPWSRDI